MLGWFKKKFSRKEEQEQTAEEVEVSNVEDLEVSDEGTPSEVEVAHDELLSVGETITDEAVTEPESDRDINDGITTADEIVDSVVAATDKLAGFVLDSELEKGLKPDSDEVDESIIESFEEVISSDLQGNEERVAESIENIFEQQAEHTYTEDLTSSSHAEITHIDVEELEFVENDGQTPVPETRGDDTEDITVVDIEDLEFLDADAEQHGEVKGEVPDEILKEIFPAPPPAEQDKPHRLSMFLRLQDRLGKTRDSFVHQLDALFLGKKEIDQELLDDLEEILITADLGVSTTMELLDAARDKVKRNELSDPQALKEVLRDKILSFLQESEQPAELVMPESGPFVIMVVGVNGVGKTTTIGKIAAKFVDSGQSVLLVAGDTFRAAAIDQLKIWGDRVGVEVVSGEPGCDPSSVVFDGVARGVAEDVDVILIDTAGRLHTSVNLMEELKKIRRVIGKKLESAPHEVMLVLDATTGQNAISQAKFFNEAVHVTGLAVTKLDGTAKGGIVANVCRELKIPVRFIGIGEQVDDLRDFDPEEFVQALFSQSEEEAVEG